MNTKAFISADIFVAELCGEDRWQESSFLGRQHVQWLIRFLQTNWLELTWIRVAFIDIFLTILPIVASMANTMIIVDFIDTSWPMYTRIREAFIDIFLTNGSGETCSTAITREWIQSIFANTIMQTRLCFTIVDINFAVSPSHSRDARARVIGNRVDTCWPTKTRIRSAFVNVVFAIFPIESFSTSALIAILLIITSGTIFAWRWETFIDVDVAILTGETW